MGGGLFLSKTDQFARRPIWEQIVEALEEFEDIRAYDEAKREPSELVPFEQAVSEIAKTFGMKYELFIEKRAQKDLATLPQAHWDRIISAIRHLSDDARPVGFNKLNGRDA
ncbi:MAG: hypothetical protein GX422_09240 [Deltaproteobacteria bacterium]|jgi:hypothetical protein|nr:hypothetical protein [Deltaproteobacteria bacterium]